MSDSENSAPQPDVENFVHLTTRSILKGYQKLCDAAAENSLGSAAEAYIDFADVLTRFSHIIEAQNLAIEALQTQVLDLQEAMEAEWEEEVIDLPESEYKESDDFSLIDAAVD